LNAVDITYRHAVEPDDTGKIRNIVESSGFFNPEEIFWDRIIEFHLSEVSPVFAVRLRVAEFDRYFRPTPPESVSPLAPQQPWTKTEAVNLIPPARPARLDGPVRAVQRVRHGLRCQSASISPLPLPGP